MKVNALASLRELQSALMQSMLDRAFKGDL
jgi:hypothetical protein